MTRKLRMFAAISLASLTVALTACSGSSSSSSGSTPTGKVQGVAIPKSVSVVTATNTQ